MGIPDAVEPAETGLQALVKDRESSRTPAARHWLGAAFLGCLELPPLLHPEGCRADGATGQRECPS